jgi:type IV pilus assembly protein PilY1
MKRATVWTLIFALIFAQTPPLRADDSDIFGANIQPNVMILVDTSGSMDDTVISSPYNPATTYSTPLTYTSASVYQKFTRSRDCRPASTPCYKVYKTSIAAVPNADGSNPDAARNGLSTVGYYSGRIGGSSVDLYVGNYRNYQLCGATCSGVARRKIDIAKDVLTNIVNNTDGVRFGIMRFGGNGNQGEGGGQMVAEIGSAKSTIVTAISGMTPSGYTPLGEFLYDAGQYYKGQALRNGSSYTSPIQYSCQPSFAILMSDGMQNGNMDVKAEATNRYTQDHSTAYTGTQNVIVHTVGFGIGANEPAAAVTDLQTAATNGGGSYYSANNAAQLEQALEDAIRQILAATFSFATPVVPTTGVGGIQRAYLAAFQSNPSARFWRGYLKAYNRDADGQIPVDATTKIPLDSALAWDAGQKLSVKSSGSRTIYTVAGGVRQNFTKGNGTITPAMLGVSTSADHDKIIDFTLGIDAYDEDGDGNTTEERAWKLGDIFHSTPALVAKPLQPSLDTTYSGSGQFKDSKASRTAVLVAGANDGMLHGFRESDGEELWAFIPPDLLDNLKDLSGTSGDHLYYMDSSPIVADVCLQSTTNGSGNCRSASDWRTIVVFGERRGGANYIALDITDTTNPLYLWSVTDSKMGETWSEPVIGKVRMSDGTARWVAFVGAGYDTPQNNTLGKAFFAIDLATGTKLWEYYNAPSSTDDRQYMNFSLAANPTAVDLDSDGFIDHVFIGDVGGQTWKFDVSAPAAPSGWPVTNWTGKRLFAADLSQANPPATGEYYPNQAKYPAIALAYDTSWNLWVYIGTGDRNHPNNTSSNRFYGFKDPGTMTNGSALTESSLVDRTSATGTVTQGWYLRLASNEKVLATADVFAGAVLFTTFTPTTTVTCGSGGGTAKLYAVKMGGGEAALDLTTGDTITTVQTASSQAKTIGTGIPSKPVIIMEASGNQAISWAITGTTNQQIASTPLPLVTLKRLVGWREVF